MSARDLIDIVTIQGVELVPIEYEGRRVLTLAMMDAVHQRPDGTAAEISMSTSAA